MDVEIPIAIIATLTALLMAFVNYRLSRSTNKTAKKTEVRAQSYIDFIKCISELAHASPQERKQAIAKLADAKARIVIYGDSAVIKELANFDRAHKELNTNESYEAFLKIALEMRRDAIGKREGEDPKDLKQILFGNSA